MKTIILLTVLFTMTSCAQLLSHRSYMSQMNRQDQGLFTPNQDFPVIAGDSGKVGRSQNEIKKRTPMTEKEQKRYTYNRSIDQELFQKEQGLDAQEKSLYERFKGRLGSKSDRIFFLDLNPRERREYLVEMGLIRQKAKYSRGRSIASMAFGDMSLETPIQLGMTKGDVEMSWGSPARVEYAGNPSNQNERWSFWRNGKANYIYFESGRVSGWELQ